MSLVSFNSPKIVLDPTEHLEFFVDKTKTVSYAKLTITSKSSHSTACRLKSSSPRDFEFNNENILIPPKSSVTIEITYKFSIDSYTKFHKFLLQTLILRENKDIDWKGSGVHEYKLFAKFLDIQYVPKPDPVVEVPKPPAVQEEVKILVEKKPVGPSKFQKLKNGLKKCRELLCAHRFSIIHLFFSFVIGCLLTYYYILSLD